MQELYKFKLIDYDHEGVSIINRKYFLDLIIEWELHFYKKFSPYKANHFFASQSTMMLIDRCLGLNNNEKSGMDLIDGEIDLDINLSIEKHSEYHTVYAIESGIKENEYEPLFLVIDDSMAEGLVMLKYISYDDEEDVEEPLPVNAIKRVKV